MLLARSCCNGQDCAWHPGSTRSSRPARFGVHRGHDGSPERTGSAAAMVELQSHHALWASSFAHAAGDISAALTGRVDAIEHIGSTAVPGLLAKPIIDMAARAVAGADPFAMGEPLEGLGYAMHGAGPKNHAELAHPGAAG